MAGRSKGARHPYLRQPEWLAGADSRPIAFAHRGGTDEAPENTLAAFEHAWALGYRYLETDVHLTHDGVLVAFHDADLGRTCDVDVQIAEVTATELGQLRVAGEHPIPLLTDLLDRFPTAHFNIDAKAESTVGPLCDLVRSRELLDRVCLASFSQRRIGAMRSRLGASLMTNLGSTSIAQLRLAGRTRRRGAQAAQIPVAAGRVPVATRRFLAAAQRQEIDVHVWTINERSQMDALLDLGVNGIMTDETALLRAVFLERGLWPAT